VKHSLPKLLIEQMRHVKDHPFPLNRKIEQRLSRYGRVLQELNRLELQHDIRILLAVESGSRAWGFASPDSDFDIRFVYVHQPDWYLSVFEGRDVIDEMLSDQLDISGWELRKTLRLFSKCNLALNEWLGSPVTYSEVSNFRRQLLNLVPHYFNPIVAIHHYRSMTDRALVENLRDDCISIKKVFYVLRPLLACRWIERTTSQPPTEFQKLLLSDGVTADERQWIEQLLEQKSTAAEAHPIQLDRRRIDCIQSELGRYKTAETLVEAPGRTPVLELNAVLREWIQK
jgi:predicted nucleotidyltransferase